MKRLCVVVSVCLLCLLQSVTFYLLYGLYVRGIICLVQCRTVCKEMKMDFTPEELKCIGGALVAQSKSFTRLSNKEESPESIRKEYRHKASEVDALVAKVTHELVRVQGSMNVTVKK